MIKKGIAASFVDDFRISSYVQRAPIELIHEQQLLFCSDRAPK